MNAYTAALLAATMANAPLVDIQQQQQLVCEHLLEAYPTPAPLSVAMGDDTNVLFRCGMGDASLMPLVFILRDNADLADWRDHRRPRVIIDDDDDG